MDDKLLGIKTPEELLELALSKEKQAVELYDAMARSRKAAVLAEIAQLLKNEEEKHVRLIEQKLADLRCGRL